MNEETGGVATPAKQDAGSKIFAHVIEHVGAAIRLVVVGFGCATLSHMLTGIEAGPRYWIGALMVGAVYLLGAIMEFAGECAREKERK